jgi:hypothetical protein
MLYGETIAIYSDNHTHNSVGKMHTQLVDVREMVPLFSKGLNIKNRKIALLP